MRQGGERGLLVLACLSFNESGPLVFLNGNEKLRNFCVMMKENLLKHADETSSTSWLFQLHKCPSHVSENARSYFQMYNVTTLNWLSSSSDINYIENL